jgi:alkylhydroperoxidase family enzyme
MPLVPFADPAAMPEKTRQSFERLPRPLNIFRMWANAATIFPAGIRYGNAILTKQKLCAARRELVILAVGRIEGGIYEFVQHVPIARNAGCRDDQVAALEAARFDDKAFDDAEKAMLRLTREIVLDVRASQAAVNAAQKFFDPQEIIEIICTVGFYMTIARLTETTRIEIDAPSGVAIPHFEKIR